MAVNIEEFLKDAKQEDGKYIIEAEKLNDEIIAALQNADIKYVSTEKAVSSQPFLGMVEDKKTDEKANDVRADLKLRSDLQASADFWNKFNEGKTAEKVKFDVKPLSKESLLVEAKSVAKVPENEETLFRGIDYGNKGFDVVKHNGRVPAFSFIDITVKKLKLSNPNAVVKIKDSVKDDLLRNKMLIACARHNLRPIGNLPAGFDFESLREQVKQTSDYEALALSLSQPQVFEFGQENAEVRDGRLNVANVGSQPRKRENAPIAGGIVMTQSPLTSGFSHQNNDAKTDVNPVVGVVSGNGGGAIPATTGAGLAAGTTLAGATSKKDNWFKRNWRKAVLGAGVLAAVMFGWKSCEDKNQDRKEDKKELVIPPVHNETNPYDCKGSDCEECLDEDIYNLQADIAKIDEAIEKCKGMKTKKAYLEKLKAERVSKLKALDECCNGKKVTQKRKVVTQAPKIIRDTVTKVDTVTVDRFIPVEVIKEVEKIVEVPVEKIVTVPQKVEEKKEEKKKEVPAINVTSDKPKGGYHEEVILQPDGTQKIISKPVSNDPGKRKAERQEKRDQKRQEKENRKDKKGQELSQNISYQDAYQMMLNDRQNT